MTKFYLVKRRKQPIELRESRDLADTFSMTKIDRYALAALLVAGITWGLTVPLSKLALAWLDPLWLNVGRFGLAAVALAPLARHGLRGAASPAVLGWGAVLYGLAVTLQNIGIAQTSVTHAALILGVVPALVGVAAIASRTGPTAGPLAWLGFASALAGIALVAGKGGGEATLAGDALVLVSAALTAVYIVAQPPLLAGRSAGAVTAVQMAAGAGVTLPVALALGSAPAAGPAAATVAAFAALVVVGSIVPFALYAYGQARVAPVVAGAFVNLEPLVGAAVGAFALGEPLGLPQGAGAAAIVAGIA